MWEKMKNKWKDFFNPNEELETDEIETKQIRNNKESSINAKVAYHYPKEKPFRFPIIPDAQVSKKEEPSYQKRKPEKKEENTKTGKKSFSEKPQKKQQIDKVPFQPSEVASPIYGYQPRRKRVEEREIAEIPAFERKKEEQKKQPEDNKEPQPVRRIDASEKIKKPANNLPVFQEAEVEEKKDAGQEPPLNNSVSIHEYKEAKQNEQEKAFIIEKSQEEIKPSAEVKKTESVPEKSKSIHRKSRESIRETRKEKRHVPFNVMMTPRDKRNQFVKKESKLYGEVKEMKSQSSKPPLHLLNDPPGVTSENQDWIKEQILLLETTLKHFHVRAKVVNAMSGPSVTRFEIQPEPGVKVSKVKNLSDDIKLNMAARDIRMEAPIPGKHTIGIEIPNLVPQPVGLQEIFESDAFVNETSPLTVALGLDIAGQPIVTNLNKMPHGLIAGATGSGKSVCINSILISLLYKSSHEDVKFLLIDPKVVELAPYNELPHLVAPVITDVKAATSALKWAVKEMEERYNKFAQERVRDIERYNHKMKLQGNGKMPYLIIVIDELADLMMASPQDVEDAICRIAQKARACGIHLLLATQRPSVDVITGLIKANVPTRIAFSVSSQVDSRTIIDAQGAEKLLGKGDMLFIENGARQPVRIQGAFVSDEEIERITGFAKKVASPQYLFKQEQLLEQVETEEEEDELYADALDFVFNHNGASASLLQRRFKIGYNRAARLIDQMEAKGIISEPKGSKPRDILITSNHWKDADAGE